MVTRRIFRAFQLLATLVVGWNFISYQPRPAFAQTAPFYQGKTIRIIVGFTAGGLYDQYARILARHMPKYIPGNPNIIVQNMPGAGSLTATNYVYSVAKPDGLTLGMVGSGSIWISCWDGRKRLSTFENSIGSAA
jgi:tripartite-type tricarboxylate transporter receptor subunit TctC